MSYKENFIINQYDLVIGLNDVP